MSEQAHEVVTPEFRITLRPDGIVHLIWRTRAIITLASAQAAISAMAGLTHGVRAPLLVETPNGGTQEREARMEFVRAHALVSAVALVVDTPLGRMLGNFFIAVSKPQVETRLFDDVATAEAWLKGYVE